VTYYTEKLGKEASQSMAIDNQNPGWWKMSTGA